MLSVVPVVPRHCVQSPVRCSSLSPQVLVREETPVSVEKPYIKIDVDGTYQLVTPKPAFGVAGVQWDSGNDDAYVDGFDSVFVASNSTDVADINAKLAQGLHVVLSPGITTCQSRSESDG